MTEPRDALLTIRDLSVSYGTRAGPVPVLRNVSLDISPGESLGLVGESGCGKSTLAMAILRHLAGRGRVDGGSIGYAGQDLLALPGAALQRVRGAGIGMVYQEAMSALNPSIPIGTQLAEGPVVHRGVAWAEARTDALEMLRQVRLPDPRRIMSAYPHQLSGGQLQRVVIAMALLLRPSLLILDEPTTALDVTVEAGIVDLVRELQARTGMALLFISHNLGLVAQVCDRLAVMYAGEVIEEGSVAEVFAAPAHPYTRGLIACIPTLASDKRRGRLRPIRGTVSAPSDRPRGCAFAPRCDNAVTGLCDAGPIPLLPVAPGGSDRQFARCVRVGAVPHRAEFDPPSRVAKPASPDPILTARDLGKDYVVDTRGFMDALLSRPMRHVRANRGLTFTADRRRTLAIVGESGCGKSTFARILSGLERASEGTLTLDGLDIARLPVGRRNVQLRRSLQMVFQNPDETLNPSFSVGRQIARAVRMLGETRDRPSIRRRVAELLAMTRLPAGTDRKMPRQLSGGQKQRVAIARAFAGAPALVVADEPVSALDVSVRAAITELLQDVQAEQKTTIILISHDLGLVRYMADRVVVMYLGRVMEIGTPDEIFTPPLHPYTAALIAAVPEIGGARRHAAVLFGDAPSALDPPPGCPFTSRCPKKLGPICDEAMPLLEPPHRTTRQVACHRPEFIRSANAGAGAPYIDERASSR